MIIDQYKQILTFLLITKLIVLKGQNAYKTSKLKNLFISNFDQNFLYFTQLNFFTEVNCSILESIKNCKSFPIQNYLFHTKKFDLISVQYMYSLCTFWNPKTEILEKRMKTPSATAAICRFVICEIRLSLMQSRQSWADTNPSKV